MASAILGALAPAAISALTSSGSSGGSSGQSSAMSGMMDTAKKASGGIMSGIGSMVSDLLHGKGFKESLAGGIDTMIGRAPQSTVAGAIPQANYGMSGGGYGASSGIDTSRLAVDTRQGFGRQSAMNMKEALDTTIRSHEGQYIVAVIPMSTFKQMVMLYMAQKGFTQNDIATVVAEIDGATGQRQATGADQNKAIAQMQQGAQQYGFPILSQPGFSSRSAQYMYPKYGTPAPAALPATQGMPAGGIVASGGIAK